MKPVKQQIERRILNRGIAQIPLLAIIFFIFISPLHAQQNHHERDSSPPLVHGGDESQQNTAAFRNTLMRLIFMRNKTTFQKPLNNST